MDLRSLSRGLLHSLTSDNAQYENFYRYMHSRVALAGLPWLALVTSDQHRVWKSMK
jgi:hypothetical protein